MAMSTTACSPPSGINPIVGISTPTYLLGLPLCLDGAGHRFAIGLYHKDRACCERCGLIRKQAEK